LFVYSMFYTVARGFKIQMWKQTFHLYCGLAWILVGIDNTLTSEVDPV